MKGALSIDVDCEDVTAGPSRNNCRGPSGLRILVSDLTYHVASQSKRGERAFLLRGVSAYFEPSQMTALMGPSGSGKTTLLDLLAGRKTVGKTEGHISFGGMQPTKQFLCRYTGYVEQFDTLLASLTVREMLLYTAELKRPLSEPRAQKAMEVEALLRRLGLDGCADVKIGDPLTKGISGGQAKRTNIGIALVSKPRVLFLDEPTSGLDSCTANEVMKVVRGLSGDGTTIAATIHSPTAATFALFDRVLLLVRGQLVYFGPQGLPALRFVAAEWPCAKHASEILALHALASKAAASGATGTDASSVNADLDAADEGAPDRGSCFSTLAAGMAAAFNVAEALMEAATAADGRGEAGKLAAAYERSDLGKENGRCLELYLRAGAKRTSELPHGVPVVVAAEAERAVASPRSPRSPGRLRALSRSLSRSLSLQVARELATRNETMTPWYWGLLVLLRYRMGRNYRDPAWLASRIIDKLVLALIILTVYLGTGDKLSPVNLINITASLFMWAILPAFGAASYVPVIILERRLFIRERADGLYRVFTYLAAKLIEEHVISLAISLAFSALVFYRLELQGQWVVFWLVYLVDLAVGVVLAYLVAAISPNMDIANIALPTFVVMLLFFAGQLMTVDSIPVWWQWFSRIDFLRYAWGALMLNQFQGRDVEFAGGMTVLQYYGLEGANMWAYIGYLAIFWLAFCVLALLALTFIRHHKR